MIATGAILVSVDRRRAVSTLPRFTHAQGAGNAPAIELRSRCCNDVWSLDFVCDQLSLGQRFLALTVVDMFTREALVIEAEQQLRVGDVVAWIGYGNRAHAQRACTTITARVHQPARRSVRLSHKLRTDYGRPGKPTDNAFVASFNGTFRDECLNAHWFTSINDPRAVAESWRVGHNENPSQGVRQDAAGRIRPSIRSKPQVDGSST